MIFDTDILIHIERGNAKAAGLVDKTELRNISIQTYMELLQHARSRKQHKLVKDFLSDFNFTILPLTENIGHRASIYVEEYTLPHGIGSADAIIAATAVENNIMLVTANSKHFKCIKDLKLKIFKP